MKTRRHCETQRQTCHWAYHLGSSGHDRPHPFHGTVAPVCGDRKAAVVQNLDRGYL
jgi:hypothetical protein